MPRSAGADREGAAAEINWRGSKLHGGKNVSDESKREGPYISPSQLCIGLHVHLDLSWVDHPFPFSSFKIKTAQQIATIQSLGLERVRYSPDKSDAQPLELPPVSAAPAAPAPEPTRSPAVLAAQRAKQERLDAMAAHRARVASCERELLAANRSVKAITRDVFSRPVQAGMEARELIDRLANSMLVEADITVHLMADKISGEDSYSHPMNVTIMAMVLAREMAVPGTAIRQMALGSLFHDIGKIDMPISVARKMEPLTKAEMGVYQQHCMNGVEVGRKLDLPAEALAVIAQHHEYVDGKGYPKGLKGEEISLLARIVTVANVFDNLCNPLNPAVALTPHEALSTMYGQQRAHFEARAVTKFVKYMGVYPPGTVVGLSNGAMGLVMSVNSARPLKPVVMVYDADVPKHTPILVDLEQEPAISVSRTYKPQQLPIEAFEYLAPRKRIAYYFEPEERAATDKEAVPA